MPKRFEIKYTSDDEYYTPKYAIYPLVKYLPKKQLTIWCPFDNDQSNFVKVLKDKGHTVINTHIDYGEDFFDLEFECDYIISNPPYSLKNQVFAKLFELKKPFAMLVGFNGLFESSTRFNLFKNNPFEIMYFNTRVKFFTDWNSQKKFTSPPFHTVYACSGILPKQIVFEYLPNGELLKFV